MQTPRPLHDRRFWLAMLAGPLFWLGAWLWQGNGDFRPGWPLDNPLPLLLAVLVYPPLEEIVFRGGLQASLQQRLGEQTLLGITRANLYASLCFALAHLWQHPPQHAAGVLLPSLLFGHFFRRHRRLQSPILLHSWYNLGYVYLFGN